MKNIIQIFCLLMPALLISQVRENKPLPKFTSAPARVIEDGITGWSYSLDGQWISSEMKIPVRIISLNKDDYETRENALGNDNIEELQLYPVLYGKDTLLMLVKLYVKGEYKYEVSQRGWNEDLAAYYFIFDKSELEKLKNITEEVRIIPLKMRAYGEVNNIKSHKVLQAIGQVVIIKSNTNRALTFTIKKVPESKTVQFQFASLHEVFEDVEGVLHDFTLRGGSVYGSPFLLDYLYYEYDMDKFMEFFSFPQGVNFRNN